MKFTKKNVKKAKEGDKVKCIIPKGYVPSFGIEHDLLKQLQGIVLKGKITNIYSDGDIEIVLYIPKSLATYRTEIYYLASSCSEVNILKLNYINF